MIEQNERPILLGQTPEQIADLLAPHGFPAYTAKQISKWIYEKKASSFEQMSNISAKHRLELANLFTLGANPPIEEKISIDGTRKYLFKVGSTQMPYYIEAVCIPDRERLTLCLSTQSGCRMNCSFCATGKQGFNASLSVVEILNQFYSIPLVNDITNFVFMGMGEPFDNTDNLLQALDILTGKDTFAFSPRRITVSTVGIIPGMLRFIENNECHLAISLHNPYPAERAEWIPAQKKYPIEKCLSFLKKYDFKHQRKLSFEYILFDGKNDDPEHATALIRLLKDFELCRVNLILYNAVPGQDFAKPDIQKAFAFRDFLTQHGIFATLRQSRGEDIGAACGLLSQQKKPE